MNETVGTGPSDLMVQPDRFGSCKLGEWLREALHDATTNPSVEGGGFQQVLRSDARRIALEAVSLATRSPSCRHEPYQGRCIHCNVAFIDGKPALAAQSKAEGRSSPQSDTGE